jgi:hypothetical protein
MKGIIIVYNGCSPTTMLLNNIARLVHGHIGDSVDNQNISITSMDDNDMAKAMVRSIVVKTKIEEKKDVLSLELSLKHFIGLGLNPQDKGFLQLLTRKLLEWSNDADNELDCLYLKKDIDIISKIPSRGHDYELAKTYGFTSNIITSIKNLNGAGIFDL